MSSVFGNLLVKADRAGTFCPTREVLTGAPGCGPSTPISEACGKQFLEPSHSGCLKTWGAKGPLKVTIQACRLVHTQVRFASCT